MKKWAPVFAALAVAAGAVFAGGNGLGSGGLNGFPSTSVNGSPVTPSSVASGFVDAGILLVTTSERVTGQSSVANLTAVIVDAGVVNAQLANLVSLDAGTMLGDVYISKQANGETSIGVPTNTFIVGNYPTNTAYMRAVSAVWRSTGFSPETSNGHDLGSGAIPWRNVFVGTELDTQYELAVAVDAGSVRVGGFYVPVANPNDGGTGALTRLQFGMGTLSSNSLAVTFSPAFAVAPQCVCSSVNGTAAACGPSAVPSTTAVTFKGANASDIIQWMCMGGL